MEGARVLAWNGKEQPAFFDAVALDENAFLMRVEGESLVRAKLQSVLLSSIIPDVTNEVTRLFSSIVTTLQLFPVPVYASALRALLDEAILKRVDGVPVLQDSFEALKSMCMYQQIIAHMSKNPSRKKIEDLRDKFLERIGVFSRIEGGLNKVFVSGKQRELLIKETFWNCVNAIRVLEFTILDLLGIDESLHDAYATFGSSVLPKCVKSRNACFEGIKNSVSALVPPALRSELNANEFLSKNVLDFLYDSIKLTLQSQFVYPCSNSGCKNVETVKARFQRCSQCKWARYCSKECQTSHWKTEHKLVCSKPIAQEALDKERLLIGGKQ